VTLSEGTGVGPSSPACFPTIAPPPGLSAAHAVAVNTQPTTSNADTHCRKGDGFPMALSFHCLVQSYLIETIHPTSR
jgi:hypothetical protein